MKIPFVDLRTQYSALAPEILPAIESVMKRGAFILGDEVESFEKAFAEFCGSKYCVGVASGCDALLWALKSCGIGPGDEVITAANTYIATALAISYAGARPVLVDCREGSYQIDPSAVEAAVTSRTRAVIPVHLYGQAADMDAIGEIAKARDLLVIEDAAQAHGAEYRGRRCGTMGKAGCFSFYPGKNLGAYGDGGAVVTDDEEIAGQVRMLRNYGQSRKYYHDVVGWNSRLDTIQAAVLGIKLARLDSWNDSRRRHAERYRELLDGSAVILPEEKPGNRHVWHLFVVRSARRDELLDHLGGRGVGCGIHYPIPVHLQQAYRGLGYSAGDFPVAEKAAGEILSLPMFPELTEEQIEYACRAVAEFF